MTGVKRFTVHGNLAGPGYQLMTEWILNGWMSFDAAQIINSFSYCGITSDSDQDYHSELKMVLTSENVPLNLTVEPSIDLDDPNFSHVFVNYGFEDETDEDDAEYDLSTDPDCSLEYDSEFSDGKSAGNITNSNFSSGNSDQEESRSNKRLLQKYYQPSLQILRLEILNRM